MGDHRGDPRGELKHGTVIAVIVLMALGLVTAWSVLIPGFMNWDDIVLGVIGSLRLTGPVAAAFAAWVALRRRRAERGRPLTAWRAAKAPLAILGLVTGSFGVTVGLLALRAALTGESDAIMPGGLAMSVAGLTLYVVVGWIAGWLLPLVVTPVLTGAGTYVLFTWMADVSTWADRLAPTTREPYELLSTISETALVDQALWLVGLSAALLLGWVALVTRRTLALAAAAIAVVAAGTGAARLVREPQTLAASERLIYSCQEWPISVCVRPEMRAGLAELARVFTTLGFRVAGTKAGFSRVEQHPVDDDEPAEPGVVVVHLDNLNTGFARRAANEYLDRLAPPCSSRIAEGYRQIVTAWLRSDPLPAGTLLEHRYAALWFSQRTDDQRRGWLHLFYDDFVHCRLHSMQFGGGQRVDPGVAGYPVNPAPAYAPVYPVDPTPIYTVTPVASPAPTAPRPRTSPRRPGVGTPGTAPATGAGGVPGPATSGTPGTPGSGSGGTPGGSGGTGGNGGSGGTGSPSGSGGPGGPGGGASGPGGGTPSSEPTPGQDAPSPGASSDSSATPGTPGFPGAGTFAFQGRRHHRDPYWQWHRPWNHHHRWGPRRQSGEGPHGRRFHFPDADQSPVTPGGTGTPGAEPGDTGVPAAQ